MALSSKSLIVAYLFVQARHNWSPIISIHLLPNNNWLNGSRYVLPLCTAAGWSSIYKLIVLCVGKSISFQYIFSLKLQFKFGSWKKHDMVRASFRQHNRTKLACNTLRFLHNFAGFAKSSKEKRNKHENGSIWSSEPTVYALYTVRQSIYSRRRMLVICLPYAHHSTWAHCSA